MSSMEKGFKTLARELVIIKQKRSELEKRIIALRQKGIDLELSGLKLASDNAPDKGSLYAMLEQAHSSLDKASEQLDELEKKNP